MCCEVNNGYRWPRFYVISYFDTDRPILIRSDTKNWLGTSFLNCGKHFLSLVQKGTPYPPFSTARIPNILLRLLIIHLTYRTSNTLWKPRISLKFCGIKGSDLPLISKIAIQFWRQPTVRTIRSILSKLMCRKVTQENLIGDHPLFRIFFKKHLLVT